MAKRLLDYDPISGIYTYHDYDDAAKQTVIEEVQDVGPWLENAKSLAKDEDRKKKGIKDSWWHVARIPVGIQYKWLRDYGVDIYNKDHWPGVRRLLNDRDWGYIRTSRGRI